MTKIFTKFFVLELFAFIFMRLLRSNFLEIVHYIDEVHALHKSVNNAG